MKDKIYKFKDLTPVEEIDGVYFKRDDYYMVGKSCGGKVRSCWDLAKNVTKGLVTAGSKASPQINIVAEIGKKLNLAVRAYTPEGELKPEVKLAAINGAQIFQVQAGYNLVIIRRAKDWARCSNYTEIPFGMETKKAIMQTRLQVRNLPFGMFNRIIMPIGSGMSLAGLLWGLNDLKVNVPIVGVVVGAEPYDRLNTYAPRDWRKRVILVKSDIDYHAYYNNKEENLFKGVLLDPVYEAKCIPYIKDGDLMWVVGQRASLGIDQNWIEDEFKKIRKDKIFIMTKKHRVLKRW